MDIYEQAYIDGLDAVIGIPRPGMKPYFWIWLKKSQKIILYHLKKEKSFFDFFNELYYDKNVYPLIENPDQFQSGIAFDKYILSLN